MPYSITVSVQEFTGVRLRLSYEMRNEEGKLVAEAKSCHCFLNECGLPIRLKRDFPDFYDALSREAQKELKEN